jgi:hypothetical protein
MDALRALQRMKPIWNVTNSFKQFFFGIRYLIGCTENLT